MVTCLWLYTVVPHHWKLMCDRFRSPWNRRRKNCGDEGEASSSAVEQNTTVIELQCGICIKEATTSADFSLFYSQEDGWGLRNSLVCLHSARHYPRQLFCRIISVQHCWVKNERQWTRLVVRSWSRYQPQWMLHWCKAPIPGRKVRSLRRSPPADDGCYLSMKWNSLLVKPAFENLNLNKVNRYLTYIFIPDKSFSETVSW